MLKFQSSVTAFSVGFVAGVGVGAFGREIVENGGTVLKPLTKNAIKGAMALVQKGREALAFLSEALEDLVAEARSELATEPGAVGETERHEEAAPTSAGETARAPVPRRTAGRKAGRAGGGLER